MTKQELIEMMGNEDRADWAIDLVLASIKPALVRTLIELKLKEAERTYKERTESGYYAEGEKALASLPEDFNYWHATPEQEAVYRIWEDRRREESSDRSAVTFLRNMNAASWTEHRITK